MRSVFIFLLVFQANAVPRTEGVLKTELIASELLATVKEGFHFNEKAPNAVIVDDQRIRPTRISAREVAFSALPEKFSKGQAAFYICDDALTFCETRHVEIKGKGGAKSGKISADVPKNRGRVNAHGFIEDDFNKAILLAKRKGQPILIDFSARWCPGCVRLETEMFGTSEFKKATAKFVKLKVDVDRFENSVLSEKYQVRGIPTLLVVNAEQEEIDRIVDYQPLEILQPFFAAVEELESREPRRRLPDESGRGEGRVRPGDVACEAAHKRGREERFKGFRHVREWRAPAPTVHRPGPPSRPVSSSFSRPLQRPA